MDTTQRLLPATAVHRRMQRPPDAATSHRELMDLLAAALQEDAAISSVKSAAGCPHPARTMMSDNVRHILLGVGGRPASRCTSPRAGPCLLPTGLPRTAGLPADPTTSPAGLGLK